MVDALEKALADEREAGRETAEKLSRALTDAATVDDLVDEYGKLCAEASRLSERDARTIADLASRATPGGNPSRCVFGRERVPRRREPGPAAARRPRRFP